MGKIGLATVFVLILLAALCAGFAGVAPASSTFNITSTDPEEPSVTVHLSGRGVQLLVTPDEGTIGDEVTIAGAGFGASKGKVLIGGVAPKITEWTDNEIKVTLSKVPIRNVVRDVVAQSAAI